MELYVSSSTWKEIAGLLSLTGNEVVLKDVEIRHAAEQPGAVTVIDRIRALGYPLEPNSNVAIGSRASHEYKRRHRCEPTKGLRPKTFGSHKPENGGYKFNAHCIAIYWTKADIEMVDNIIRAYFAEQEEDHRGLGMANVRT